MADRHHTYPRGAQALVADGPTSRALAARDVVIGDRVVLRPYRIEDATIVWQALEESRDSLMRWVPDIGRKSSVDQVHSALANLTLLERESRIFSVWDRAMERFLGEVGIYSVDRNRAVGEIGYWLRSGARGNGYMREALGMILQQAVETEAVHSVEARIPTENHQSRRVVEGFGFSVEAQFCPTQKWEPSTANMLLYSRDLV